MQLLATLLAFLSVLGRQTSATFTNDVVANFDDIPASTPGAEGSPVPTPYKGLNFSGFSIGAAAPVNIVTLLPSSLPNFAYNALLASQVITSKYQNSKVKSFDLYELKTGCYPGTRNGVVAPPINCTFLFTGTYRSGATVKQSYDFGVGTANGIGTKSMQVQPVKFSRLFTDLTSVSLEITKSVLPSGGGTVTQFAIDDVAYNLRYF